MPRPPRTPCRSDTPFFFELSNGQTRVMVKGSSEAEAAAKIPIIYGAEITWAICEASSKRYEF